MSPQSDKKKQEIARRKLRFGQAILLGVKVTRYRTMEGWRKSWAWKATLPDGRFCNSGVRWAVVEEALWHLGV